MGNRIVHHLQYQKTGNYYIHETMGVFFIHQHRTKMTERVKDYLETKKLTLDGWLSAVKYGRWGDIMTVYVLSLMKGILTLIHLKNGKIWSTLHATLMHHNELIE